MSDFTLKFSRKIPALLFFLLLLAPRISFSQFWSEDFGFDGIVSVNGTNDAKANEWFAGEEEQGMDVGADPLFAVDDITLTGSGGTPPLAGFTVSSDSICEGTCISFTDTSTNSPTGWTWYFPGGTPATSNLQNPTNICYSTAGTYDVALVVSNGNGTDSINMVNFITVIVCPPPLAGFTVSNDSICDGDCINFTDISTNLPSSWMWYFPGGTPATSTLQNPTNICYNTAGTYDVALVVTNISGTDSINMPGLIVVDSCSLPVADFTASAITVCKDSCISFTDLSTGSPSSWLWTFQGAVPFTSTLQNPSNICYADTGTFSVNLEVTNANGTHDTTFVAYISVQPCFPVADFDSYTYCLLSDSDSVCIDFDNNSLYATSYQWTFYLSDTTIYSSMFEPTICYNTPGQFDVLLVATNIYGTDSFFVTGNVVIGYYPLLSISPGDTTINRGDQIMLSAFGTSPGLDSLIYFWSSDGGLTWVYDQSLPVKPDVDTEYIVCIKSIANCMTCDTMTVKVVENYYIGVPQVFSPNSDGLNDVLYVLGNGIKRIDFVIYNRYGQKVFESTSQSRGWDGKHKNKAVNPGVFVYYLKVTLLNNQEQEFQGNITLVR